MHTSSILKRENNIFTEYMYTYLAIHMFIKNIIFLFQYTTSMYIYSV